LFIARLNRLRYERATSGVGRKGERKVLNDLTRLDAELGKINSKERQKRGIPKPYSRATSRWRASIRVTEGKREWGEPDGENLVCSTRKTEKKEKSVSEGRGRDQKTAARRLQQARGMGKKSLIGFQTQQVKTQKRKIDTKKNRKE